jgi:hypothetical protein
VPPPDRWDHWVFTIGGNGWTSGESTQSFATINSNLSANRITEDWKLTSGVNGSYNEQKFPTPTPNPRAGAC